MKLFVIFSSLAACCMAGQSGYNYVQPEDLNLNGNLLATYGGMYGAGQVLVGGGGGGYQQPELQYAAPVNDHYRKEFFTFSAPDEDFEDMQAAQRIAASMQKNLRVVFIRAPENRGLEHAALTLAKQSANDRTAIFVLNKQHDIGDLANRLSAVREQHSQRPEVHFVKYRTPEEAAHAQRYIQAQYDTLQGSSRNSDGGVAPVLNFASRQVVAPVAPVYTGNVIGNIGGANVGATGSIGGGVAAYYGGGGAVSSGNVNVIGEGAAGYEGYAENTVGRINAQLAGGSGSFVFPTSNGGAPSSSYLPPITKAKQ